MHGTADTSITMDQFAKLANELENKGVSHEMITYSGAPHAFTVLVPTGIGKMLIKNLGNVLRHFLKRRLTDQPVPFHISIMGPDGRAWQTDCDCRV